MALKSVQCEPSCNSHFIRSRSFWGLWLEDPLDCSKEEKKNMSSGLSNNSREETLFPLPTPLFYPIPTICIASTINKRGAVTRQSDHSLQQWNNYFPSSITRQYHSQSRFLSKAIFSRKSNWKSKTISENNSLFPSSAMTTTITTMTRTTASTVAISLSEDERIFQKLTWSAKRVWSSF